MLGSTAVARAAASAAAKLNLNLFPPPVVLIVPVPDILEVPSKFKSVIVEVEPPNEILSAPNVMLEFAKLAFEMAAEPLRF